MTEQNQELVMALADCPPIVREEIARLRHALAAQWGGRAYSFDLESAERQRDEAIGLLSAVASIAHCCGLEKMTESTALTAIRRATIRFLYIDATEDQHRAAIERVSPLGV